MLCTETLNAEKQDHSTRPVELSIPRAMLPIQAPNNMHVSPERLPTVFSPQSGANGVLFNGFSPAYEPVASGPPSLYYRQGTQRGDVVGCA